MNTKEIHEYTNGIFRNYPLWPSTFGACSNKDKGCNQAGRGSGLCADCYEKKLAEIVGKQLAKEYHDAVKNERRILGYMLDMEEKINET